MVPAMFLIRVFGSPVLRRAAGSAVGFGTRKHLGVLLYLALEGRTRPVSRDRLIDLFWPHVAAWRGRHSLSQALTVLRRVLGRDAFSRGTSAVQLVAPVATELDAVDQLRECEALDAPLDGVDEWAGPALAHWVDSTRVTLKARAAELLRDTIQRARRDGDVERVFALAHRLYVVDPVSDLAVQAIAEDRLVHEDSIGALHLLREHVARVEALEGCKPSTSITRLLRRLESGTALPVMAVPTRLAAAVERVRPSIFVGRELELARLEANWSAAQDGRPRTVLVTSTGGIGKSALLRRFATGISSRASPVHLVACQEIAAGIPYAAVSDLLASLLRDPAVSGTDPTWLAEATRIFPALRARYPGVPQPPQIPPEMVCVRVAEAICRMIEAVAEDGAVLLAFDDVQHLDATSRDVLVMIRKRLTGCAAMVLAAARSDYLGDSVGGAESPHAILTWDDTVVLAPLADLEIVRLVHALSPELEARPRVRDEIVTLAQGNPYFAEMLVADWTRHEAASLVGSQMRGGDVVIAWSPPDSMRSAFARHYEGLSETARHMLHVVAVARRGLSAEEIASSLGTTLPAIDTAVLETIERRLVRLDGPLVSFKNELHRAYVYWVMPADARRYHHGRLAQALERLAGEDAFGELLEAGRHFLDAGRTEEALGATIAGAKRAIARGAPSAAENALQAMIQRSADANTPDIVALLAEAQLTQGKYNAALHTLATVPDEGLGTQAHAALVVLKAEALHRQRQTDDRQIITACRRAVAVAQATKNQSLVIRAAQVNAEAASEIGLMPELEKARLTAWEIAATTSDDELRARAGLTEGYCDIMSGNVERAAGSFKESAAIFEAHSVSIDLARAHNGHGMCALATGSVNEALDAFSMALRTAHALGDIDRLANVWGNLGVAYELVGDFRDASSCYDKAVAFAEEAGNPRRLAEALLNAADLCLVYGTLDEMERRIRRAAQAATESQLWRFRVKADMAMADMWLARGEPELAWPIVERTIRASRGWTRPPDFAGRYRRLQKHYSLAASDENHITSSGEGRRAELKDSALQIADRLEIAIFDEWAEHQFFGRPLAGKAARLAAGKGFYGVLARLIAVGVTPALKLRKTDSETTVQLLERAFPLDRRRCARPVPSEPSRGVESPRSDRMQQQHHHRTETLGTSAIHRSPDHT